MKSLITAGIAVLSIFLLFFSLGSQGWPQPHVVEVEAVDHAILSGDYYTLAAESHAEPIPAVLVLNEICGSSRDAHPLVTPLLDAGFAVLAVDIRGTGETEGCWHSDLALIKSDLQRWFAWLRAQPEVRDDAIATLGSCLGGELALLGCAEDRQCMTAIALSPSLDGYGITREVIRAAMAESMRGRPALLLNSTGDARLMRMAEQIVAWSGGETVLHTVEGNGRGQYLFSYANQREAVIGDIVSWLVERTPPLF